MPARRPVANKRKRQPDRRPRELPRGVHRRSTTVGIYLLLTGLSLAVFSQTIHYNFVNFDDDLYVYNAPAIQAGLTLKGIAAAFTSPHARNWHPLTTLSHMVDCQLYGLNAGGHHATNIILHIIAVLLLFRVLRQMTGAVWKSIFVAALFAVHPLHVESVAWVSERKDVLSAVFFMLTLGAYTRYIRTLSFTSYLFVLLFFAFGLMSKPILVTVPFVLLLLDYWPLKRFVSETPGKSDHRRRTQGRANIRRILLEKMPLLLLSFASCAATVLAQRHFIDPIDRLSLAERLGNAAVAIIVYLRQLVWPSGLSAFYPHPRDGLSAVQISM